MLNPPSTGKNRRHFLKSCAVLSGALTPFHSFAQQKASEFLIRTGSRPVLRAGAARRRVTPPEWVPYLTSSGNGTNKPFGGVHDDLFARALVLDDGNNPVAILAVDSIGYDNAVMGPHRNFTAELRQRVAAKTGLNPAAILLSATHSHSTPETICLTPFLDTPGVSPWLEEHLGALVDTAVEAWKNRVSVRASSGQTTVSGISRNRRIFLKNKTLNRRGPIPPESEIATPFATDESLNVLYCETLSGRPHSVLLNYTAHPVIAMVLPPVSADYPGAATAFVEKELQGAVCLFTNGAAGDINTEAVSTNFDDVLRVGNLLGEAALKTISRLKSRNNWLAPQIQHASEIIDLDGRPCPSVAEAEKAVQADSTGRQQRLLRLARKLAEDPLHAEVQVMRLGDCQWVALPGEVFVETGLALKRNGATFVVGYANGWLGYFPIRRAYDEGGYEVDPGPWSRVAPGSAETLEKAGIQLLQSLSENSVGVLFLRKRLDGKA